VPRRPIPERFEAGTPRGWVEAFLLDVRIVVVGVGEEGPAAGVVGSCFDSCWVDGGGDKSEAGDGAAGVFGAVTAGSLPFLRVDLAKGLSVDFRLSCDAVTGSSIASTGSASSSAAGSSIVGPSFSAWVAFWAFLSLTGETS
jgi:hypothetical protein